MSRPSNDFFSFFSKNGVQNFVETGTWMGGGVSTGLRAGFKHITSIESVKDLYLQCNKKFEKEILEGRVELLLGDSGTVLTNLPPVGPTVYWLDAHYQGKEAEFHAENCPLDGELRAIIQHGVQDHVILIDDLRLLVDPKAWRGHKVEIDRSFGKLMLAFPDHIAFLVDGHVPRDIFALIPGKLARAFMNRFPNIHITSDISIEKSQETAARGLLAICSNGHNDRIGNLLPLYGRLHMLSQRLGRKLSFPFAEKSIIRILAPNNGESVFHDPDKFNALLSLYGRIIRTSEEQVEVREKTEPFNYSQGVLHRIDYPEIGLRTLFSRGTLDMHAPESQAAFDTEMSILWKEPYPLSDIGGSSEDILNYLSKHFCIRKDILHNTKQCRNQQFGGALNQPAPPVDLCFHVRQGDFRRWKGGTYYYDHEFVAIVITALQEKFRKMNQNVVITLLSDEPLPDSILAPGRVELFANDFELDFLRIALADIVVSNSSTFSQTAASLGKSFLKNGCRYYSLGAASEALPSIEFLIL
jgi:hypothetical protein